MSIGQELLDVPFPEMVTKLALGIASAQHALDANSIETAELLAAETIDVVPSLVQTVDQNGAIHIVPAPSIEMTLLQVGLNPTFYQFSEATIETSMDIRTTTSTETNVHVGLQARVGFAVWSVSVRADYAYNRKMGKEVHGTSRLYVKMVPVPPPAGLFPQITTVQV